MVINIAAGRKILNFFIFFIFFVIFFLYQQEQVYQSRFLLILINSLILVIFISSIYNLKNGIFILVFFIPLLNSLTTILGIRSVQTIFCLFFALFLGFIVNRGITINEAGFKKAVVRKGRLYFYPHSSFYFDKNIFLPFLVLIFIILISSAITIYRYSNFLPFLSHSYHNLIINLSETRATESIHWTINFFFNAFIGFGFFIVIFNGITNRKDVIKTFTVILASNFLVSIFGLYQYFINPYIGSFSNWVDANRINSTFTDPNALGNYIVLMFPLYIALLIYYRKWWQKFITFILLILFSAIAIMSGSRNAFIAIFLTTLVFIIIGIVKLYRLAVKKFGKHKIKTRFLLPILVFFLIIVLVVSLMLIPSCSDFQGLKEIDKPKTGVATLDRMVDTVWMYLNNFSSSRSLVEAFKSISSYRHFLWAQAINMFMEYPATGVGMGSFILQLPNYYEKYNSQVRHVDFAGNYYLQVLSEIGLPGLILILFIFYAVISSVMVYYRNKRRLKSLKRGDWMLGGLFISFLCMCLVMMFGTHTNFDEIQISFWLIIGLIFTYVKINTAYKLQIRRAAVSGNVSGIKIHIKEVQDISNYLRLGVMQKISLAAILVIFFALFFLNSINSLSVNIQQNVIGYKNNYGFYQFEKAEGKNARWTDIDASEVMKRTGDKLGFEIKARNPDIEKVPVFVRFYYNNSLVKVVTLKDEKWQDILIDLPGKTKNEMFTFSLTVSRGWVPKEWDLGSDTRTLGILTGKIESRQ